MTSSSKNDNSYLLTLMFSQTYMTFFHGEQKKKRRNFIDLLFFFLCIHNELGLEFQEDVKATLKVLYK